MLLLSQFLFCFYAVTAASSKIFNAVGNIEMFYQDSDLIQQKTAVSATQCAVFCSSSDHCVSTNYNETDRACKLLGSNLWKFPQANHRILYTGLDTVGGVYKGGQGRDMG